MVEVTRRVRFEAAHFLPDYIGACGRMHGHSWYAWIVCAGELEADGMVIDMGLIAAHFRDVLEPLLDHSLLNNVITLPTTENVAQFILDSYLAASFPVIRVTVQETENQTATVRS